MNYEKYSNLVGKHAMFSPSSISLADKADKDIIRYWARKYIPEIGTGYRPCGKQGSPAFETGGWIRSFFR